MANIAEGIVRITVRSEELIARFEVALKETTVFDYQWKTIDRIVLDEGGVAYDISFFGKWNCDDAWEFLEGFCDDSTEEKFEFDGNEIVEEHQISKRVYRNAESGWDVETEDTWTDEDEDEDEE